MLSMETLALARAYADKIKQQIGPGFTPQIVESLPTVGDAKILYLVPKQGTAPQGNIYDEYLWIGGAYEPIGDTATSMTVDSVLSDSSTNPVQNKILKAELDKRLEEPTDNPNNVSVVVYNPSTTETHGYTLDSTSITEGTAGLSKIPTSYAINQAMTKISKVSTADLVNNAITLSFADALVSTYIVTNDANKPSITFGVTEDFKDEFIGRKIIINYITSLTPSNILTYSGNDQIEYEREAPTPETTLTLIEATLCKNGTTGTINDFLVYVSYKSI